jgi:hypothetical protein
MAYDEEKGSRIGHVRAPPYLRVSQLIRLLTWVPESFPRHDRFPTRTCPTSPSRSAAKFQNRTCPILQSGSSKVGRTCLAPERDMSESLTLQRADSLGGWKSPLPPPPPCLFNPASYSIHLKYALRHTLELKISLP